MRITYLDRIKNAIIAINPHKPVSRQAIRLFLLDSARICPGEKPWPAFPRAFRAALKKGVELGQLKQYKSSFRLILGK